MNKHKAAAYAIATAVLAAVGIIVGAIGLIAGIPPWYSLIAACAASGLAGASVWVKDPEVKR